MLCRRHPPKTAPDETENPRKTPRNLRVPRCVPPGSRSLRAPCAFSTSLDRLGILPPPHSSRSLCLSAHFGPKTSARYLVRKNPTAAATSAAWSEARALYIETLRREAWVQAARSAAASGDRLVLWIAKNIAPQLGLPWGSVTAEE